MTAGVSALTETFVKRRPLPSVSAGLAAESDPAPSFEEALQVQLVLDAVERSAATWTRTTV